MTPPIIGLDATYALDGQPTGVGVYCAEMVRGLPTAARDCRFRYFARPHRFRQLLAQQGWLASRLLFETTPRGLALFHGLNQRLPQRKRSRSLCTFHDLFVLTADYSTPEFRARFAEQARHAARHADLIVAVSRFTANQVRDLLGIPESRLRVVRHGVRLPTQVEPGANRAPIILHTGAIQKRKNLAMLVRAFAATPARWQLHLVGSDGYGAAEVHEEIERSARRTDIIRHGYASAADLASLYQRASLFAFPSWGEGFGIPVLEAMAHGIPVIASNATAIPEAAGGAAELLDPGDETKWRRALSELCEAPARREQMTMAGLAVARENSWSHAVEATAQIYRELLP